MIKIILGLIVIVFIFWGFEGFQARRSARVAIVNGETISIDEYRSTYNNLLEQYRQNFGNNFTEETLKLLQLDKKALDYLIEQKLMVQEAEKLSIRVSDEEIVKAIQEMPVFQRDGSFDSEIYRNLLRRIRMSPEAFEYQQRLSMTVQKLHSIILGNVLVSETETRSFFDFENAETKIGFVLFAPEIYTGIDPTEDDLKAYFEQHKERYKTQPEVKVNYLYFNPETFLSKAVVTDQEIADYYDANVSEFSVEKTVEARHILLKLDQEPPEDQVEEKRKKILEILAEARAGKDFAELANTHSEGPTGKDGGYLGSFTRDKMVQPFADAAFSLKPGEISEPVRTQFGWHLIKVENVSEARTRSLEEASGEIKEKLAKEKAREFAAEEADAVYEAIFGGDDLAKAAEAKKLSILETGFFSRVSGLKDLKLKSPGQFIETAFGLKKGDISEVKEFADGYYILQATDTMDAKIPELKTVKDRLREEYIREKQEQRARDDAAALLAALKEGADFEAKSRELDRQPGETEFFKRNQAIPNIGFEQEISQAASALNAENKYPSDPIKGKKGYYVIAFKERKLPGEEVFEKERQSIEKMLLQQKQTDAFQKWISLVRQQSEIVIEEGVLST
jgi:peptidyl-prolyl cis-trans isomerase D